MKIAYILSFNDIKVLNLLGEKNCTNTFVQYKYTKLITTDIHSEKYLQ